METEGLGLSTEWRKESTTTFWFPGTVNRVRESWRLPVQNHYSGASMVDEAEIFIITVSGMEGEVFSTWNIGSVSYPFQGQKKAFLHESLEDHEIEPMPETSVQLPSLPRLEGESFSFMEHWLSFFPFHRLGLPVNDQHLSLWAMEWVNKRG